MAKHPEEQQLDWKAAGNQVNSPSHPQSLIFSMSLLKSPLLQTSFLGFSTHNTDPWHGPHIHLRALPATHKHWLFVSGIPIPNSQERDSGWLNVVRGIFLIQSTLPREVGLYNIGMTVEDPSQWVQGAINR